ncbi:hypothetical protein EZ428_02190 [Pedobacter frigiditerrae]|uniref:Uncharacterized protein n=1 Tax=Pedobacter frigiditerrae TaxID=2530452 RepID=A0A4R0N4W7_9SPHI|nr:hypothetical protein [Pedobacter frigiditerrae]TCC93602.1 hypothetical protein EZ428_02190 [Pedobacter frigiditerrae]
MKKNLLIIGLIIFVMPLSYAQQIKKNSDSVSASYKRSSLYTLMTTNSSREYETDIQKYFVDRVLPDKYNNHNLSERYIEASSAKDELTNIKNYLAANKIAQKLVAKWFNRSEKGGFNMNLIKERGFYDANILNIEVAKSSKRGLSALADAGEELIGNTFVLVNDSKYTNKEEVAGKARALLGAFASKLGAVGSQLADQGLKTFGKGFVVATHSHLFKLVWNEEIQSRFYNELWADDKTITPAKKLAFDNADFFKLEYIGTDKSFADVQSTAYTTKSNSELIGRATVKSIENVISKLQGEYDVFKTKMPLFSIEPLTAKIGLKDGVTEKTKFEVLEQQEDEKGKTKFVQIGTLKVDTKYPIWDNKFAADEENPNQKTDKTYFKKVSGKDFYPGLLIRQVK